MRRGRLLGGARGSRGTTLTEMLVVMLILGMVTAATVSVTIGFQRTNAQNISRQDQIDAARTAVERMSKTVRSAVKPSQLNCTACTGEAFVWAHDFSVQFYADLDPTSAAVGPRLVTYTVATSGADAGVLIEDVQVPDLLPVGPPWAYCDAKAPGASVGCKAELTTRRITAGVQAVASAPMLKYYDASGGQLTLVAGAVPTVQLPNVFSVELVLTVQAAGATQALPTTYIERVTMPNAQALRPGQASTP